MHKPVSMSDQETWVARPGELIRPSEAVEEFATRIGGLPVYPQGCSTPSPELTTCQACGKQLALLLQAHAPLTAEQTGAAAQPRRFLYLFGCTAEGCGKESGCWRALRLTLPDSTASNGSGGSGEKSSSTTESTSGQQAGPAAAPPAAVPADDWGMGSSAADDWGVGSSGADDWGTDEAGSSSTAAFDFGDLNAALEAVGSAAATGASKAAKLAAAPEHAPSSSSSSNAARPVYDPDQPCLPAFYLYAEPESQCTGSSSNSSKQSRAEHEHLQQLLARYEKEAAAACDTAGGMEAAAAAAASCTPSVEGGPESWSGEGYEEDAVLAPAGSKRQAVDAAYIKFSKQLAKCPDQCARYSFGGSPLWPSKQPPPPPEPCSRCGGQRVFELQLMTPVIPGLSESVEWLAAERQQGAGGTAAAAAAPSILLPPDSWEWLTVCLYSCRGSCDTAIDGQVAEELLRLANE